MLTIAEAQRRTELFLTCQMLAALHAVEYELQALTPTREVQLAEVALSRIEIRMCAELPMPPTSSMPLATLLMQLQLNVHRLVVVYRVPRSMGSMLVLRSSQMIQFIRLGAVQRAVSSQSDVNHPLLLSTGLSFRMVNKEAYSLTRFNWVKNFQRSQYPPVSRDIPDLRLAYRRAVYLTFSWRPLFRSLLVVPSSLIVVPSARQ